MKFYPTERLAIFVDGQMTWNTSKALGFDIDYAKLQNHFGAEAWLVRCSYFTPLDDREEFTPVRPLVDWLEYNGWMVTARQSKSTAVDLAVQMLEISPGIDHFILFSGDGDFVTAVEALQRRAKRVTVVSSIKVHACDSDLRRQADGFMELDDLRKRVERLGVRVAVPA